MDFSNYGNITDPMLTSKKRLVELIEPADQRPSCSPMSVIAEDKSYKLRMSVWRLGSLVATAVGDPATGRLEIVGLALSAKELHNAGHGSNDEGVRQGPAPQRIETGSEGDES